MIQQEDSFPSNNTVDKSWAWASPAVGQRIKDVVLSDHYFFTQDPKVVPELQASRPETLCVLLLVDGEIVIGKASWPWEEVEDRPAQTALARKNARRNAMLQLWLLHDC